MLDYDTRNLGYRRLKLNVDTEGYSREERNEFKRNINNIIVDTFIKPSDSDYLIARFCGLNSLRRAFFWPALQTIEKLLKANLLFHGVPVKDNKKYGHKIVNMANKLKDFDSVLSNLKLTPHKSHIELKSSNLWKSENPIDFLKEIEDWGDPNNRYNLFGIEFEPSSIFMLDQIVFALRSNIVKAKLLPKLEDKTESIRYYLYEQNFRYAPASYKHQSMYNAICGGGSVPTIMPILNSA